MNEAIGMTREERAKIVAEMNANFAIEDMEPDEGDKRRQQQFIDGTATLDDLLNHAKEFASKNGEAQA